MKAKDLFGSLAVLTLGVAMSSAQEATPVTPSASPTAVPAAKGATSAAATSAATGLLSGPASVPGHWSKNKYPSEIPEGASYYVVVRDDTLWDIAKRYLGSAYLWPQVWDQNKYISDAHWIYPGDPIILPKVAIIADSAGSRSGAAEGMPDAISETGDAGVAAGQGQGSGAAVRLSAVTEETTLQCAEYIASTSDDESFRIVGSEEGQDKIAYSVRDVVYLNRGSSAGVKAGDRFMIHRQSDEVVHPKTRKRLGKRVLSPGWLQVVLVREDVSVAVIEESCSFVQNGDYLLPFERVNVPLISPKEPANRLTPSSGKLVRTVVEISDAVLAAATGQFVHIDAGSQDGVTPGAQFMAFQIVDPAVPTPRAVLGELVVVAVREKTCLAKIIDSKMAISRGSEVEAR